MTVPLQVEGLGIRVYGMMVPLQVEGLGIRVDGMMVPLQVVYSLIDTKTKRSSGGDQWYSSG